MSCSNQGAVLSADSLNCSPAIGGSRSYHGGSSTIGYNFYCKADCQGGAVKLDTFSSLKTQFSSLICQKNVDGGATLGFGKRLKNIFRSGSSKPSNRGSTNCPCSALMFVFF